MFTLTRILSDEPIGAEEEQQTFSEKLVKIKSRRDGVPLAEIQVGKMTDCVRVFDKECNSAARVRLRSIIPDEGVTRERNEGVRNVLKEKSFFKQIMSGLSVVTCMKRSVR